MQFKETIASSSVNVRMDFSVLCDQKTTPILIDSTNKIMVVVFDIYSTSFQTNPLFAPRTNE